MLRLTINRAVVSGTNSCKCAGGVPTNCKPLLCTPEGGLKHFHYITQRLLADSRKTGPPLKTEGSRPLEINKNEPAANASPAVGPPPDPLRINAVYHL